MTQKGLRLLAASGLAAGGVFRMAGTFAPSAALRGLAWGIDGVGPAVLFVVTALQIFAGIEINLPTTSPLPFFAYPVLVATLAGWIVTLVKADRAPTLGG